MDIIEIKRVINKNGQIYNVDWKFNLEERKIEESLISQSLIKFIFGKENIRDIEGTNLILLADEGSYYCYNCIFSFKIAPQFAIYTSSIDYVITNSNVSLDKLQITKYKMIIELPKETNRHYVSINKNITFKYNKFITVDLKKEYFEKRLIMTILVTSSKVVYENKLSSIAYNVYELLIIYLGEGIKIIKRMYCKDEECKELFCDIVEKYSFGIKNFVEFGNFIEIDQKSINKEILIKFEQFKEKTYLLNDVFLTITNSNMYKEIKINMMVQAIEGFYKSIIGKAELHDILNYTFLNNKYYDKLLSKKDRKKVKVGNRKDMVFLYKAKNHRNYFTHLNENERKKVFNGLELNYAYWKIHLAYRLLIMKYLGIQYDVEAIDKIVAGINEYMNN